MWTSAPIQSTLRLMEDQRSKLMCPWSHSLAAGELCLDSIILPPTSWDLPHSLTWEGARLRP